MKRITAAIKSGVVADVEAWDDSIPPGPRADGLRRFDCPEWVHVGCRSVDGVAYTMPDGSNPPKEVIDRISERDELAGILDDMIALRPSVQLMKTVNGTTVDRVKRLEEGFVKLFRAVVRLVKSVE